MISCLLSFKERLLEDGSVSFFVRMWYMLVYQKRKLTCRLVVFCLDSAIEAFFNFLTMICATSMYKALTQMSQK